MNITEEQKTMNAHADHQQNLSIKGIREGLLISIGEGEWIDIQANLLKQIEERGTFFKGARLAIDVGNRILHAAEMGVLRDKLSDREIGLWAIISNSPVTERTAQVLGLATRLSTPKPERVIRSVDPNLPGEDAILIQKTLRSGFRVSTHGHVVVIGDVNPGAEILSDGNIIVWGRLRGSVHAGAQGNQKSVVCALEMNPTQLRIANIFYAPAGKKKKGGPELVRLENGQVLSEQWNVK